MATFANMLEKSFSRIQVRSQLPNFPHPAVDHCNAARLVAVKNLADLRQTQTHPLTGLNDTQSVKMLLRIVAVPRRCPWWHDDTFIFPMSQHVGRDTEPCRCLADSHVSMILH